MGVILMLLGMVLGVGIGYLIRRPKPSGYIRVDRSEPDEPPMLFLESHIDIYELTQKKHVTYTVKTENYISHK